MDESKPVDRRRFINGSFILGLAGGAGIGAVGMRMGEKLFDPRFNERRAHLSYAQAGEDLVIWNMCHNIDSLDPEESRKPTYLDIGAWDPIEGSNTYLFYKKGGCRGVLVEPNVALCRKLESARPGDTVVNAGIGFGEEIEADYYLIAGPQGDALNTFDQEVAEAYKTKTNGAHYIDKVVKVRLLNINNLMEKHFKSAPNILSIDAEGFDLKILKSMDFTRYRPDVVCVETVIFATMRVEQEIIDLMLSKNYAVRGGTLANTVFLDRKYLGG